MSNIFYTESELQKNSSIVLCIEEKDPINKYQPIDSRIFISWDNNKKKYYLCGRRQDVLKATDFIPYSFYCKRSSNVYEFIKIVIGSTNDNTCSTTLYNFNNLENILENERTYEFYESLMDRNYEIVGYDNSSVNSKILLPIIKLLKYMHN